MVEPKTTFVEDLNKLKDQIKKYFIGLDMDHDAHYPINLEIADMDCVPTFFLDGEFLTPLELCVEEETKEIMFLGKDICGRTDFYYLSDLRVEDQARLADFLHNIYFPYHY